MLKALSVNKPTLCVGADVHLDEIVLRAYRLGKRYPLTAVRTPCEII